MKKVFLAILAIAISTNVMAQQGVNFFQGTIAEAFAKAKQENKFLFVDCYTTWCGPCKILANQTFPSENVGDFMNPRCISLKIDCEKGEGITFAQDQKITSYPTLIFFSPDGKKIEQREGAPFNPYEFVSSIESIFMSEKDMETLSKAWETNKTFENGKAAIGLFSGDARDKATFCEEVLAVANDRQKYDPTILNIYLTNLTSDRKRIGSSPYLREYVRNIDKVQGILGRNETNALLNDIYTSYFSQFTNARGADITEMERLCAEMKSFMPVDSEVLHNGLFRTLLFKGDIDGLMDLFDDFDFHGNLNNARFLIGMQQQLLGLKENASPQERARLKSNFGLYAHSYNEVAGYLKMLAESFDKMAKEI